VDGHPEGGRWPAIFVEEIRICLSIYTVRANVFCFQTRRCNFIAVMDSMKTYNIVQYEAMQGIVNKQ